jgi:hypothetical protein
LNFFVGAMTQGVTDEQIQASLAGSPEYFQVRAGNSNDAFVAAV